MAINRGDTDTIDVECLASSIEDTMSKYDLFMPTERCIFKTPIALYRHNEKAYIPDAFSIGPLHHGPPDCPKFQATETIKAKYLEGLISRYESPIKQTLKDIINSVNALEGKARKYYAGPVDYSREEFVKILVIDSCFMIELFWRKAQPMEENDPIFGMSSMVEVLGHDLILLENQVPWMVLEHLFSMMVSPICEMTLMQLAIAFFGSIFALPPTDSAGPDRVREIKHIPDLLKKWLVSSIEVGEEEIQLSGWALVPSAMLPVKGITRYSSIEVDKEENSGSDQWELIPSATHLEQAGIKFRMSKSKNMFDIRFANGVLEIPQIIIHEITETFFRNLISFEQCYPKSDHRITSYAILLDNLINTAKDVEILCENKILSNWLNPQDAAGFFNKLYHDTFVKTYYHGKVCREVNNYCGKKLPRWRALLVRKYFNNPWASLSTLAAVILLILTLIQTCYSIKS